MSFWNNLLSTAKSVGGDAYLTASKYGPTAMVVGGVVGVAVSFVMGCKASTKLEDVMKAGDKKIAKAHKNYEKVKENPEVYDNYTEEDFKKELLVLHTKKWFDVVKLYAPSVGLGALSIAAILGSHGMMTGRNAALAAAYKAVDVSFKKYRKNVIEELGAERDEEFSGGKILVQEGEKLEVVNVKAKQAMADGNPYGFWFNQYTSTMHKNDPIHNKTYLLYVENWANMRLNAYGHIMLNEILDELGMERVDFGQVVGWSLKTSGANMDHFVDFGLAAPINRAFNAEETNEAFLNFNVNGTMYQFIGH